MQNSERKREKPQMTEDELYALPVSFDLETAGRPFGMGRTKSHEMARAGQFPCEVLRVGKRYVVLKVHLLAALGLPAASSPEGDPQSKAGAA